MNRLLFFFMCLVLAAGLFQAPPVPAIAAPKETPAPGPTPTPPGAPSKLDGVWEVQMQRGADTTYTHFKFAQNADGLAGIYRDTAGKIYPISGSYDGKNLRIVVTLPDKSTISFTGYIDSPNDMVGMADFGKETVPFTAAHREKVKFLEGVGPGLPSGI